MATKTIGITEPVYNRLRAHKREGESFTELIDRLLDEIAPDWRDGFGTLDANEMNELHTLATASREALAEGLADRQRAISGGREHRAGSDEAP